MKYFLVSDIHSYYDELVKALNDSGYDKNNKDHCLVVLGDVFDRGPQTLEMFKFITSLPKENRIFIRGNHEDLYLQLLNEPYPDATDFHNGTVKTFCDIAKVNIDFVMEDYWFKKRISSREDYSPYERAVSCWELIKERVNKSPITKFIRSKEWKNYFEINDYICVHGYLPNSSNWRNIKDKAKWTQARWSAGYRCVQYGLFNKEKSDNKTLICGHVPSFICKAEMEGCTDFDIEENNNSNIYFGDGIICIDACTAETHKVNVLVIDNKGEIIYGKQI